MHHAGATAPCRGPCQLSDRPSGQPYALKQIVMYDANHEHADDRHLWKDHGNEWRILVPRAPAPAKIVQGGSKLRGLAQHFE